MVLKRKVLYFLFIFLMFFFLFGPPLFGREVKKDMNIEDVFLNTIQKNFDVIIHYTKKRGNIITGFTFEDISIYRSERKILTIEKLKWAPNVRGIKNPLLLFNSFSLSLTRPTLYISFENSETNNNSYMNIDVYRRFFEKIKNYNIRLKIENGCIKIPHYPSLFANGTVLWNKLLAFDNVKVKVGNGVWKLDGTLDPLSKDKNALLKVIANNIPSPVPYYYKGDVNFRGVIHSLNGTFKIKGNLELQNGIIYIRKSVDNKNFFINPYLDLILKVGRNVKIKGGIYYEFSGKGLFQVGSSLAIPRVIGKLFLESGRVLFGNRYFKVVDGTSEFTDFAYLDPVLSINTQGEVDGIKIFAHISGFSRKPKVYLSAIPPFSQDELSSLIMLGKKIEDYKKEDFNEFLTSESLNIAFRTLSLKFMNSLDEVGRRYLGLDTLSLEPSFEVYNEDIIKTKLSLKLGKYVGKDFYIKYERVLTPYANDVFGFEFYPIKGLYFDFSIDKKSNIQVELIYEYTF